MFPFPIAIAAQRPLKPLILSPTTSGVSATTDVGTVCYAGIQFRSAGTHFATPLAGTPFNYDRALGNWLDQGDASRVWIQWVRTGGLLTDWNEQDSGDARLNFTGGNYAWAISRGSVGISTLVGRFDFYNAESDGDLLATTGDITFQCTVDSIG